MVNMDGLCFYIITPVIILRNKPLLMLSITDWDNSESEDGKGPVIAKKILPFGAVLSILI